MDQPGPALLAKVTVGQVESELKPPNYFLLPHSTDQYSVCPEEVGLLPP